DVRGQRDGAGRPRPQQRHARGDGDRHDAGVADARHGQHHPREDVLMRIKTLRDQSGFTLVELMVAMSIFLLILVGVFQVFDPSSRAYSTTERKLGVQQNARVAMDVMARQIRMAGYYPENIDAGGAANDVATPVSVQAASASALAVAGDLDASCASPATGTCAANSTRAFTYCLH